MTAITFSLSASTDLETLVEIEQPALRPVRNLLQDMIEVQDFGTHTAEIGADQPLDERGYVVTGDNHRIDVIFFPGSDTAGIRDNATTRWTDASSVADAIRRYREDELAN